MAEPCTSADTLATLAVHVTVARCTAPEEVIEWVGVVPVGFNVAQALDASGHAELAANDDGCLRFGIWGKACELSTILVDGDRVEIYRPLRVDPKTARRERFAKQGARTAGLFARVSKT